MGWPTKDQLGLGFAVTQGYGPVQYQPQPLPQLELYRWMDTGTFQESICQRGVWIYLPSPCPYLIPAGSYYTVPANIQISWEGSIDSAEPTLVFLDVSGYLIEI